MLNITVKPVQTKSCIKPLNKVKRMKICQLKLYIPNTKVGPKGGSVQTGFTKHCIKIYMQLEFKLKFISLDYDIGIHVQAVLFCKYSIRRMHVMDLYRHRFCNYIYQGLGKQRWFYQFSSCQLEQVLQTIKYQ